jgi:hypothetical protein
MYTLHATSEDTRGPTTQDQTTDTDPASELVICGPYYPRFDGLV